MSDRILQPGTNCWRLARARRVALLVDAAAYYGAFAAAARRARRSILVVGWDTDSRVELRGPRDPDGPAITLGALLDEVAARRRELHAHILSWDFSTIYTLERQFLPAYHLGWRRHRKVHFQLDAVHPIGGSHHQKIVVVDDALAFSGGLDLTVRRWDTQDHDPRDRMRKDPAGKPYNPFHDVQIAVDGDAAAALGELARERWRRATGAAPPEARGRFDPWPPELAPDLEDVDVGIARTDPGAGGAAEVREVERLYLDAIAAARAAIYIESQYVTSTAISEALAACLQRPAGPDVVVVCPEQCCGWLERRTMGVLTSRFVARLRAADRHGRLRVLYPTVDGAPVFVHSKVLVVDDRLLRVGSANLTGRSMGLDTECDLAVEAAGDARARRGIAAFRDRLLGEHLGADPRAVAEAIAARGGLIQGIEALSGGRRTLRAKVCEGGLGRRAPSGDPEPQMSNWEIHLEDPDPLRLVDLERPVDAERLVRAFVHEPARRSPRPLLRAALALCAVVILGVVWRFTPLAAWIHPGEALRAIEPHGASPLGLLVVLVVHGVASLAMVPVNLLIAGTALVFGPALGAVYALAASLAAAVMNYFVGRALGSGALERLSGGRALVLSERVQRRGLLAVLLLRLVPSGPFGLVNLVAGAARIRLRDFVLGTLLGLAPGVALVSFVVDRLLVMLRSSEPASAASAAAGLAVVVALVLLATWLVRVWRAPGRVEPA